MVISLFVLIFWLRLRLSVGWPFENLTYTGANCFVVFRLLISFFVRGDCETFHCGGRRNNDVL
jgi:hypothetical protein